MEEAFLMNCTQSRETHHNLLQNIELTNQHHSAKAIWDFEGIFCSSRHIPGVRFAGLIHPGILGCAPSPEVLETWNTREAELISTHSHLDRDVALPPQPQNVHAGSASSDIKEKVGKEGARTVPGRPEHGGNCDIKNLSRGSKVYLPVHVKGAKFSVGDLHFSQGIYLSHVQNPCEEATDFACHSL
jgi:formamidase